MPGKTSLNRLLIKEMFPYVVFSAQAKDHIVQTCNDLGAPRTEPPHPCITPTRFSFSADLNL